MKILIFFCFFMFIIVSGHADNIKSNQQLPSTSASSATVISTEVVENVTKTISKTNKEIKSPKISTSITNGSPNTTVSKKNDPTTETTPTTTTDKIPQTTTTDKPPQTTTSEKPPPTTTSEKPPPTTTSEKPTTEAPTPLPPVPDPVSRKWQVNGTNETIIVQMAAQLVINYTDINAKNLSKVINIQPDNKTLATGTFAPYNEVLKLSWKSSGEWNNSVQFFFTRDNKTFELKSLEVTLDPADLPNSTFSLPLKLVHTKAHFNTSLGNSYRCIRLQTFNLTISNDTKLTGQIKVSNLQFQPFKTDKKDVFGFAEDCAFETPDVVPIAVGCILAALVVIVLVAYLINRKNRSNGYHSM